jgi:hypothetical protein
MTLYRQAQNVCLSAIKHASRSGLLMDSLYWMDDQFEKGTALAGPEIDQIRKEGNYVFADALCEHHRASMSLYHQVRAGFVLAAYGYRHPGLNFDPSLS